MTGTWQEDVMLLHARGWSGELVDEACAALIEACAEGAFAGRNVSELAPGEAQRVLAQTAGEDELRALCRLAGIQGRLDATGEALRGALRDLDAFADSLGER